MPQPALVSLAIAGEFIAFFILGGIAPFAASGEKKSLAENVVAGFIVAHAAAEVVSIFGALAGMTLTSVCFALAAVFLVLMGLSVYFNFSSIFRGTSSVSGGFRFRLAVIGVILLSVCFTALVLLTSAPGDPIRVIAQMSADLYSDTIGLHVPGSDTVLEKLPTASVMVRFYSIDTLVCRITGLSPLVQMKTVRTCVVSVISCMIVYRFFFRFFEADEVKASAASALALIAGAMFRTPYTPHGMLFSAGWTGKATLAVVLIPSLFLITQALYDHPDNPRLIVLLVLSGIAAVSLCGSALLVWPVSMAACIIGISFVSRRPKLLLAIPASAAIPCIIILFYINALTLPVL